MSKISLIIKREYYSRVKKKSFIIMTILGPLLMAGIIMTRIWFAMLPEDVQMVQVIDEVNLFDKKYPDSKNIFFFDVTKPVEQARKDFYKTDHNVLVYIPKNLLESNTIQIYYKKQPGYGTQEYIRTSVKNQIEKYKLMASGIDLQRLESVKTNVNITTSKLTETGSLEKSSTELSIVVGFAAGFLIYIFIFLYGAQVMRGVIEEKTNRIIEVIISSVKPFELMMGKIIGIALVGLTQFLLWVVLTFALTSIGGSVMLKDKYDAAQIEKTFKSNSPTTNQGEDIKLPGDVNEIREMFGTINFPVMILCFIFYFLFGYLLYAALFAAIGAAVDSEADTQQFMLPLTIPLILAFIASQVIITNPESTLAFWFSVIPLTSPVVMMVRIPFGVPIWEVALSAALLIGGFLFTTWIAGRIYRTGILMYGKKITYKELYKWLFYKHH